MQQLNPHQLWPLHVMAKEDKVLEMHSTKKDD